MSKSYLEYDWTPVINFETGGEQYYNKVLKKATYPGGASGVTIGIGADLGYLSRKEFDEYFANYFTSDEVAKLHSVIGLKGSEAKAALSKVRGIELSWNEAKEIFVAWTLPKFWKLANGIWPGLDELCENAQIALTSIVFNRGSSLKGSGRKEMVNIQSLIPKKNYKAIAKEIRNMKRLWVNKGLDGLLKRRDIEAKMVDSCA